MIDIRIRILVYYLYNRVTPNLEEPRYGYHSYYYYYYYYYYYCYLYNNQTHIN